MASITTGLLTTGSDFIGLDPAMKIIFDELTDNIVADSEGLDIYEQQMNVQTVESDGGRYISLSHYYQMPGSVGARLENDYIPEAGPPGFATSQIYMKKNMGTVQMSGEAYRRAKEGPGAFITWGKEALPSLVRRMTDNIDRQIFGYGQGIMARVSDASPSTTVLLTSVYGVSGLTQGYTLFNDGMTLRYGPNADASALRSGVATVKNVAKAGAAGTLTIDALPTSAAQNDYIFMGDSQATSGRDSGTVDKELMGFLGIVDDGTILSTFQGLARSGNGFWNAQTLDTSTGSYGSNLSEDALTDLDFDCVQLGNGRPSVLIASRSGWKSFWKTLRGDRMFTFTPGSIPNYKGGGMKMEVQLGDRTLSVLVARKCPPQVAFLVEPESFKRWHNAGFTWDDTTGSIWNRVTDANGRKDAYYATGYLSMATGNLAPAHNGLLKNMVAG